MWTELSVQGSCGRAVGDSGPPLPNPGLPVPRRPRMTSTPAQLTIGPRCFIIPNHKRCFENKPPRINLLRSNSLQVLGKRREGNNKPTSFTDTESQEKTRERSNSMPPTPHHVLLLGGHGKVAQLLTPLLLRRGWDVTSVIRSEEQVSTIQGLAPEDEGEGTGKLKVLVRSLEEVKSESDAGKVISEWGGDYVVWSAGKSRIFHIIDIFVWSLHVRGARACLSF
ncbi:hypothetical protein VTG60DRAFT_6962 [Thermothelomyces hinnuleus]